MVHPDAVEELKKFVRQESRKAGQGEAEFVRANSHIFRRWVAGWHQRKVDNLRVVDSLGDEVEFCTARYGSTGDRQVLLTKLRSLDELMEEKPKGATLRFGWMDPGKGRRRVHGGIEVTESGLRLDTSLAEAAGVGARTFGAPRRSAVEVSGGQLHVGERSNGEEEGAPGDAAAFRGRAPDASRV